MEGAIDAKGRRRCSIDVPCGVRYSDIVCYVIAPVPERFNGRERPGVLTLALFGAAILARSSFPYGMHILLCYGPGRGSTSHQLGTEASYLWRR